MGVRLQLRRTLVLTGLVLAMMTTWSCSSGETTSTAPASTAVTSSPSVRSSTPTQATTLGPGVTSPTSPALSQPAGPSTILILGSDYRPNKVKFPGSSDVIMLLHVDPQKRFLSVLSVTRDLWVDIPGHGKGKINSAYFHGQVPLATQTVEAALGVHIDHFIVLGFTSFQAIIDSAGGAFVDVDRLYDTQEPRPIDIKPGYQALNGADALNFARYRFDQNSDFGRMSRQQWILSGLREQAKKWDLALVLPALVGQALESVQTDLSAGDLVGLVTWIVGLDDARMKQSIVRGPGSMINGESVIVVDEKSLRATAADMLVPPGPVAPTSPDSATGRHPDLIPDLETWKALQATVPFPLEAPTFIPGGFARVSTASQGSRAYAIQAGGSPFKAVRVLYRYKDTDFYLGVTATPWTAAPVAAEGIEVPVDGVVYTIVGTQGKVHHIWWVRSGVLYFISNSVMWTAGRDDLLRMAASMVPVDDGD